MLDQYRRDYAEFNAAVMREHYLFGSGQKATLELARIYERFSDLFSCDAIEKLKQQLDETSAHFETERASLRHLLNFAVAEFLEDAVKELTEAISASEAAAVVELAGCTMTFQEALVALATEHDRATRQAIDNKRLAVIAAANDLRAERLLKLHEAARSLGYENYTKLFEQLRQLDYEQASRAAAPLLGRTEAIYVARLNQTLQRDIGIGVEEAERSDYLHLIRLTRYDARFPAARLMAVYRQTMAGLGINIDAQRNIEIDSAIRPRKKPRAYCVPIVVPDEIKLMIRPAGGQADYKALLHEAGHSQHYGWTAAGLRPEFKYTGDYALSESYAFLFQHLLTDRAWLTQFLGFANSHEFTQAARLIEMVMARRSIAKLVYEQRLHTDEDFARAAEDYAESLTDATKFKTSKTEYLSDTDEAFYVANYVRAWAFASQLRDYLQSRFGLRWWDSPRAGNFLKEMWETGDRYTADEMASQIGVGPLSFDLLIDEFNQALK
jgi:cytidylate kinase